MSTSIFLGWRQKFQRDQSSCWNPDPERSPPSPGVWWEVTSGAVTGAIFISLSQSSCFVLAGSIRSGVVGSVLLCPCQQGIQAFLTGAHHMAPAPPSGSGSTQLQNSCGLAHCHLYSGSTHMTTVAESDCVWQCVCVHADEVYDLVCTCGMTEGPHIGELFLSLLATKSLALLSFKGNDWVWTRFSFCLCTGGCCFYNTEVFYSKNDKDVEQRASWWTDFCAASLSREGEGGG